MKYLLKIDGVPSERKYNALAFGWQLAYRTQIDQFKKTALTVHYPCKGKSTAEGFREFFDLYKPSQWFAVDRDEHFYHDDSIQIWYTEVARRLSPTND